MVGGDDIMCKRILALLVVTTMVLSPFCQVQVAEGALKIGKIKSTKAYTKGSYCVFEWSKAKNATRYKVIYTKKLLRFEKKTGKYKITDKWKVKYKKKRKIKIKARRGEFVHVTIVPCRGKKQGKFKVAYRMRLKSKYKTNTDYDLYLIMASYFWNNNNFPYTPESLDYEVYSAMVQGNDILIDVSPKVLKRTYKYFYKYEKIDWADAAYRFMKAFRWEISEEDLLEEGFKWKDINKAIKRAEKEDDIVWF